jgi:hypothetical protein
MDDQFSPGKRSCGIWWKLGNQNEIFGILMRLLIIKKAFEKRPKHMDLVVGVVVVEILITHFG